MISISVWLDYSLWGLNPLGYHLTNTVFHGLNAFLVGVIVGVICRAFQLPYRAPSIIAGACFLLMPSHTEAVSWISGRTDVIATFFCLGALLALLVCMQKRSSLSALLYGVCLALALLSKEAAAGAYLLAFMITVGWFVKDRSARSASFVLATVAIGLMYALARFELLSTATGGYNPKVFHNFSWVRIHQGITSHMIVFYRLGAVIAIGLVVSAILSRSYKPIVLALLFAAAAFVLQISRHQSTDRFAMATRSGSFTWLRRPPPQLWAWLPYVCSTHVAGQHPGSCSDRLPILERAAGSRPYVVDGCAH